MAKSIAWPDSFRDALMAEDDSALRIAIRLGTRYADPPGYWQPGERVDLRAGSKVIRPAVVVGPLRVCPLSALTDADFERLKPGLDSLPALIRFLEGLCPGETVTPETVVTVVTYQNRPVDPDRLDF